MTDAERLAEADRLEGELWRYRAYSYRWMCVRQSMRAWLTAITGVVLP